MTRYFECPCCGCISLSAQPYAEISHAGERSPIAIPYESVFGAPSYEGCDSCGYEFGFDDNPGGGLEGQRFSEHRASWLSKGGYNPKVDDPLPDGARCRVDFEPID